MNHSSFEFRFGLSKWGDSAWKGDFYPKNLATKEFLQYYANLFATVEVNATYYRIFKPEVAESWRKSVAHNPNFKFVLKVPAALSGLSEAERYLRILDDWLLMIDALGNSYGACFIQYNGRPGENAWKFLEQLQQYWPKDIRLHLEIRHAEWFENKLAWNRLTQTLAELGIGMVITDSPGRQDVKHPFLTAPCSLVRYVGYDNNLIDKARISHWKEALQTWEKLGVGQTYFLFHNPSPQESLAMGKELRPNSSGSSARDPDKE